MIQTDGSELEIKLLRKSVGNEILSYDNTPKITPIQNSHHSINATQKVNVVGDTDGKVVRKASGKSRRSSADRKE